MWLMNGDDLVVRLSVYPPARPQLFKCVPCPRHRMPGYERSTDTLVLSHAEFDSTQLSAAGADP